MYVYHSVLPFNTLFHSPSKCFRLSRYSPAVLRCLTGEKIKCHAFPSFNLRLCVLTPSIYFISPNMNYHSVLPHPPSVVRIQPSRFHSACVFSIIDAVVLFSPFAQNLPSLVHANPQAETTYLRIKAFKTDTVAPIIAKSTPRAVMPLFSSTSLFTAGVSTTSPVATFCAIVLMKMMAGKM